MVDGDGAKRPRRTDGAPPLGRGVPPAMAAAAARALGGTVREPERAAAVGAGGAGRAEGGAHARMTEQSVAAEAA